MARASWLVPIACLAFGSPAPAGERFLVDIAGDGGLGLALRGSATVEGGADPQVDLTGPLPHATGGVWIEQVFDLGADRVAVHFECSAELPSGAPPEGEAGGGLQLVFQLGDDFALLGEGGASLGTGGLGAPYLGVAMDAGADGPAGPGGAHLEINHDGDPAAGGTVAWTERIPDLLGTGAAGARVRFTVTLDRERVTVFAASDHDCFGGGRILEHAYELPPGAAPPLAIGFTATSTETPVSYRLHRIEIEAAAPRPLFLRGDCNQDGAVCGSVSDMIAIIVHCFLGGAELPCEDACDVDDNGTVCGSVTDIIFLASYCFLGSVRSPPAPFWECGGDPTSDGLACGTPRHCGEGHVNDSLVDLGTNDHGFREYVRLRDDMLMVEVPAGTYEQGDRFFDFGGDELPVHRTTITRPFLLGKFEATVAQYRRYLDAIGCDRPGCFEYDRTWDYEGPGAEAYDGSHYPAGESGLAWSRNESYFERPEFAAHPVLWVDWFDAVAYSRWANDERGRDWDDFRVYGIPTEAEWEYAARYHGEGVQPSRYPWGGSEGLPHDPANINENHANFGQNVGRTVEVCSYPAGRSFLGIYNQSGNVYEWTADWYDGDSYKTAPERDPFVAQGAQFRQLRGGGWFGPPFSQRGAYRCNFEPEHPDADVGFRSVGRLAR